LKLVFIYKQKIINIFIKMTQQSTSSNSIFNIPESCEYADERPGITLSPLCSIDEDICDPNNITFSEKDEEANKMDNLLGNKRHLINPSSNNEGIINKSNGNIDDEKEIKKKNKYSLEKLLKFILTACFNYILTDLNKIIFKCYKNKKILLHVTNYKEYQGKPTIFNIKRILKKTVKEAFSDYGIYDNIEGITLQKDNKNLIDEIYQKEDFPSSEDELELKNYLEMDICDAIKKFYDNNPQELKELRKYYQKWDECFYNEKKKKKGFYLLQNYGLIKYYEMTEHLFKFLVDKGRKLIKECNLEKYDEFGKMRLLFYSPTKYPKNRDVRNNSDLLKKRVKELLEGEKDKNLEKNKILIDKLYRIESFPLNQEQRNLKTFLEMNIQEVINKYYNTCDEIIL